IPSPRPLLTPRSEPRRTREALSHVLHFLPWPFSASSSAPPRLGGEGLFSCFRLRQLGERRSPVKLRTWSAHRAPASLPHPAASAPRAALPFRAMRSLPAPWPLPRRGPLPRLPACALRRL